MDRENVISTFEKIISVCKEDGCDFVDLTFEDAEQVLALLKEQEEMKKPTLVWPVPPERFRNKTTDT